MKKPLEVTSWSWPRLELRSRSFLLALLLFVVLLVALQFNILEDISHTLALKASDARPRSLAWAWGGWAQPQQQEQAGTETDEPASSTSGTSRIVLWTKFYEDYDYSGAGVEPGLWDECAGESAGVKCDIVYVNTTEELRDDDAIVFHVRNLEWDKLPKRRHPDQLWIFFLIESPQHSDMPENHLEKYGHMFNWTFTYRQDSDVPYPYGVITKHGQGQEADADSAWEPDVRLRALIANKSRLAAVLVSHCNTPSRRESLIRTLQHYVDVDVFGHCSVNVTCGASDGIDRCTTMACRFAQFGACHETLARSHKFYLSFENSLCSDYVTEKFFMALQHDIVPVVYGGADYGRVTGAPPSSYINSRDFDSPKELAKHLQWLDDNPKEYLQHFRWKEAYSVSVSQAVGWCALCSRLRQRQRQGADERQRKSYGDIRAWWISAPSTGEVGAKPEPACEPKPKFEYEGWEDKKFNYKW